MRSHATTNLSSPRLAQLPRETHDDPDNRDSTTHGQQRRYELITTGPKLNPRHRRATPHSIEAYTSCQGVIDLASTGRNVAWFITHRKTGRWLTIVNVAAVLSRPEARAAVKAAASRCDHVDVDGVVFDLREPLENLAWATLLHVLDRDSSSR